jgi:hypothetical protein
MIFPFLCLPGTPSSVITTYYMYSWSLEQETGVLRKEALKFLESAEAAKRVQEQLAGEAESLLAFLRQVVSSCQGTTKDSCPCCNTTDPQSPPPHEPVPPFRKGKTPERLLEPIPETKGKQTVQEINGGSTRQRNDSERTDESDLTSSDNESHRSILRPEPIEKAHYQKS